MDTMKVLVHSPKSLGQAIQRARYRKKLTQTEAGAPLILNQATVSSIENGAAGTRLDTLFRLLAALELELVVQERPKNLSHDAPE